MPIDNLVRKGSAARHSGVGCFDSEEKNFVVQQEFVHLSPTNGNFTAFLDCLNEPYKKYLRDHDRPDCK